MKKLLLVITLLCISAMNTAFASEFKNQWYWHMEVYDDVFWCNLLCDGEKVDLNVPPPDYDPTEDLNLDRRYMLGYEDCWHKYMRQEQVTVEWNGIVFDPTEEPPNYSDWDLADTISAWSLYFNEMYYDGGPEYALDERTSALFWNNLTFKGEDIDIYEAPPNYVPEMDYWRDVRSVIGYAWYWEYYICGEIGLTTDEITYLSWNGITFNGHDAPPNYIPEDDPFYFSRIRRGHMDYWAKYFLSEDAA